MTASTTRAVDDSVPVRAAGVELLGELPGSGYRKPPALARRADGQTIQLTPLLYLVLVFVDGKRSYDDIAAAVGPRFGRLVSGANVRQLVDQRLRPLGLLRGADGSEPRVRMANPLLGLRFRFVLSNPDTTRRVTTPLARLFNPLLVVAVVLAFALVCYWVLFEKGLASAAYEAFQQPGLLLAVFAVTVASAGFHELGHAAAARRGGSTPGAMGAGLYLVWPAFYTDVTDSYRLGRGGRVRTDLGGLYFNAIVAVAMFGTWWITGWDALLLIIATQLLQMIRQLAPLVRFDGYHVLADLTGVPDLFCRIGPTLRGLLPNHWRDPDVTALKPWARAVVTLWVVLVVPLLLLSAVLMVVALPRILATGWAGLGRQWAGLGAAEDLTTGIVRGLAIVAIALPLLGIVYLVARLGRQIAGGVWRATRGRPGRRAVAGVVMAAVLAWLGWMWWPDADTYRPIGPNERGTVQDAVAPAAATGRGRPAPAAWTPARLAEGTNGTARTAWPAGGSRPTAERPELALILVPKAGADPAAPTWVFPFSRPPAPGVGNNQALAVNTTDGSTVYEVAFALVWVTDGGTVDNRNEAYALASCRDCATVAVGFQVVLVVGQANVVVPQNIAVAVNYACVECLTVAVARQLVVTLPVELGDAAMAELARVWRRLEEFGRHIREMSLSQVQAELTRFEAAILGIVRRDVELFPGAPGSSTTVPPPTSSTGPGNPSVTTTPGPTTTNPPATSPSPAPTTQPPTTSEQPPSSPTQAPSITP